MGFLDAGWQHAVTRETEPSGKGRGAVSKEMILRQAQGKRLFYERSVLLRYMPGVKNGLLTQPVGQKNYLKTAPCDGTGRRGGEAAAMLARPEYCLSVSGNPAGAVCIRFVRIYGSGAELPPCVLLPPGQACVNIYVLYALCGL